MKQTRLQQHRHHQFNNKMTFLIVAMVVLVVFFLTGSIWFFSAVGSFMAKTNTKQDHTEEQNNAQEDMNASLSIDDLPTATGEAQFTISGDVETYDTITFFINGKEVGDTRVKSNGTFRKEIGFLEEGENTVFVRASSSKLDMRENSDKYRIMYLNEEPTLEITEPTDGSKTSNYDITVVGITDVDNTVYVNGSPTVVNAEGTFQSSVRLTNGDNEITVVARDKAHNETEVMINVTHEDD